MRIRRPFRGKAEITQYFGGMPEDVRVQEVYRNGGLVGHNGIDFGIAEGSVVLAVAGGEVDKIDQRSDYGLYIEVKHQWGISLYAHLSEVSVKVGQKIRAGQKIALSGASGFVTGPHLHLGIRLEETSVDNGYWGFSDPASFLK